MNTINKTLLFIAALGVSTLAIANGSLLVEPSDLAEEISNGAVIIDLRENEVEKEISILPGSVPSPFSGWRGPSDNPGLLLSESRASELFGDLGIAPSDRIILATAGGSNATFGAAARAFWDLKSFGFDDVGILHGGVTAYQAATLSFADSYLSRQPKVLSLSFDTSFYAPKTDLLEVVEANQSAQLLDARPSAWHEGKKWHPASLTPGTLEFSKILDYSQFFVTQDSSRLKAMGEIEALLDASNVQPNNISFCEAGWWSAGNWFIVSQLNGYENSRLYAEGRIEWSRSELPQVNVPTPEELEELKKKAD
ncbi:rhodanese-like domain-containing protein [Litorivicinus sp.]|nr:rhodanese-like domain-containing protein [Litorivicinus sp.]